MMMIMKHNRDLYRVHSHHYHSHTPPKINIEPENDGWEYDFPFPGCILRFHVKLPGCTCLVVIINPFTAMPVKNPKSKSIRYLAAPS